ncbi:hypothetical protein HR059_12315 [Sinorhizobium meliloti WSM1022]|jgi:hypothetical protein|uniref:hypothetical protein n=1 Tax=Rhizobium meliloti TaxID=382 RepID=UPI000413F510|nr:hypothetical protein [Sinorhizobium meliloti]ASQ03154.1 hypothetical protein CDO23_03875 [Sinorhizobium meliloti]MCO6422040.1 hypothetical protein [Sinorhizobium meliloti]MDW9407511.1 hypothetical protein [Sinorhizobium meliloti]MDW9442320.1 hypothetical protein [Sinorhizobium meliloti]MDW9453143.1 hypothetical protein [Sinorhizobium meliloti]
MARLHRLERLTKWASRPEWNEAMENLLDSHVFLVTGRYDLDLDQLADIIGETAVMNLWACAFEDLLSRDFDGRNVVDDYLKRRGWKESASNRAYIKALSDARMSLYEVSGLKRGHGFYVRDLLRGGEPVWVSDGLRANDLAEGDRLAARLVEVNGQADLGLASLWFSLVASEEVIETFEELKNLSRKEMASMMTGLVEALEAEGGMADAVDGISLEEFKQAIAGNAGDASDEPMGIEAILASSPEQFTNIWLEHMLNRLIGPPPGLEDDADEPEEIDDRK